MNNIKLRQIIAKWFVKLARKLDPMSVSILRPRPIINFLSSERLKLVQLDRKFYKTDVFRFTRDNNPKYMIQCVKRDLADGIANSDIISWSILDDEHDYIRVKARLWVANYSQINEEEMKDFVKGNE